MKTPTEIRVIPGKFRARAIVWQVFHIGNRFLSASLSVTGVVSGLMVAALARHLSQDLITGLGLAGAISAGLLSVFKPQERGDRFLRAWRCLDEACSAYEYDLTTPVHDLIVAVHQGESLIGTGREYHGPAEHTSTTGSPR